MHVSRWTMSRATRTAILSALCAAGLWAAVGAPVAALEAAAADGLPGPKCYRKVTVEAAYETSTRLVRKARLEHEEAPSGQITMIHYPAIYIEERRLVSPEYVLLQEVKCTKRVLRRAEPLPTRACLETKGCTELEPPAEP